MTPKGLLTSLPAFVLTLSAAAAHAGDDREQALERSLQQRDQVIIELLERVEALERRVGVQHRAADAAKSRRQQEAAPATEQDRTQGAAEAPGRVVVAEGAAERALERSLTLEGALLLPSGVVEVEPGFIYSRVEDSTPGFFSAGGEIFPSKMEHNVNNLAAVMSLRLGLPWDSQLEMGIPWRWRKVESVTQVGFTPTDASSDSASGWGDVNVGLAKTLLHEAVWRPDLIGRLTWNSDTGETQDNSIGLGDGFQQLRGSLTAIKRQDPVVFVGGLSYEHTFEQDQVQPGPTVAANFGGFIALSPETSLRLSFSAAYQDETELSGQKIDGSDRTIGSVSLGSSTLVAPGILLNLSVGIGLTDDADDFSLLVSLPIRLSGHLY